MLQSFHQYDQPAATLGAAEEDRPCYHQVQQMLEHQLDYHQEPESLAVEGQEHLQKVQLLQHALEGYQPGHMHATAG
jgi:hypothetical protein